MADSNKTEQATPRHRHQGAGKGPGHAFARTDQCAVDVRGCRRRVSHGRAGDPALDGLFPQRARFRQYRIDPGGRPTALLDQRRDAALDRPILAPRSPFRSRPDTRRADSSFAPEALSIKPERLSPSAKLKHLFSPTGLSTILKSLLPFAAIGWVGYACISSHWEQILSSSYVRSARHSSVWSAACSWRSAGSLAIVLVAWAGVDYFLLWLKSEGDLKMSRQEIKRRDEAVGGQSGEQGQESAGCSARRGASR